MSLFKFDVKYPTLYTDYRLGWPAVHPDVRAMLEWQCDLAASEGWARPLVTEFGRTRDIMEGYYLPGLLQELEHQGLAGDANALAMAKQKARSRYSWHCIPKPPAQPLVRAFDLRDWLYTDDVRQQLLAETEKKFPSVEALDHAVVGGGRHFHFGIPDINGFPADWF